MTKGTLKVGPECDLKGLKLEKLAYALLRSQSLRVAA